MQNPKSGLSFARVVFAQGHDLGADLCVGVGILMLQILRDAIHVLAGQFSGHARLQAGYYSQIVGMAVGPLLGGERKRNPVLGFAPKEKITWHDANNGGGDAVKKHATADDGWIMAKTSLPECVADHGNFSAGFVFRSGEGAAERGLDAKEVKEVGRHFPSGKLVGFAVAGEAGAGEARGSHVREGLVLCAPLDVVARSGSVELEADK